MKKLAAICLSVICIGAAWLGWRGYSLYQAAVEDGWKEKVEAVQKQPDYTSLEELPEIYIKAVVSVEDHRFYRHKGVDLLATMRAAFHDIMALSFVEGGSTITQQLAKNLFFTQDKVMDRKVAEMFMAWRLEREYEKDEILELYVNSIYFGSGYQNVRQASIGYFHKEPIEMTDGEAVLLAGIPNAPSVYSLDENPKLAYERQRQVLSCMVERGEIEENQAKAIIDNNPSIE